MPDFTETIARIMNETHQKIRLRSSRAKVYDLLAIACRYHFGGQPEIAETRLAEALNTYHENGGW